MRIISYLKGIRDLFYKKVIWRKYKIGENFHCARGVFIWGRSETDCIIGDNVIIANHVGIVGKYDHNYQEIGVPIRLASQIRDKDYNWKGCNEITIIEDDVWIGFGAIIMSGTRIAKGSIIAAGAIVTKNTEPYSIYAGIPARKISNRFDNDKDLQEHILLTTNNNE